jgi:hypothetical protein
VTPPSRRCGRPAYHLVGAASPRGYSWEAPIVEQVWLDLVSAQPDFTVMPWVEARLAHA